VHDKWNAAALASCPNPRAGVGDGAVSYVVEWVGAFIAPMTVVFLLVPGFVLIALTVVLMLLAVVVVALAAAIVVTPYLVGNFLRGRWRALPADRATPALPAALDRHARRT
jgi:hypothetical protein